MAFQSTLPARGATPSRHSRGKIPAHFNPRSPHGERRGARARRAAARSFQSTLPARGATCDALPAAERTGISIHAPRTGSDKQRKHSWTQSKHFNPRSPHGERLSLSFRTTLRTPFQSTLPARGATCKRTVHCQHGSISIHAPRTGSDVLLRLTNRLHPHFNPRSPHGERPCVRPSHFFARCISIHAPRTGSDLAAASSAAVLLISIHAPRTGSDLSARKSCTVA